MNPAAALGKLSAQKRFKGKSKKQISKMMSKVRRKGLKKVIPTSTI